MIQSLPSQVLSVSGIEVAKIYGTDTRIDTLAGQNG